MCCTIRTGSGKFAGRSVSTLASAFGPPVDTPIASTPSGAPSAPDGSRAGGGMSGAGGTGATAPTTCTDSAAARVSDAASFADSARSASVGPLIPDTAGSPARGGAAAAPAGRASCNTAGAARSAGGAGGTGVPAIGTGSGATRVSAAAPSVLILGRMSSCSRWIATAVLSALSGLQTWSFAPAATAASARVVPCSVFLHSMITGRVGRTRRMPARVSSPSISGISTSRATTSGESCLALAIAILPEGALPTTSISGSRARLSASNRRITTESSTISTRMLAISPSISPGRHVTR